MTTIFIKGRTETSRVVQIVRRESEEVGRQTINQSQGTPRERIETSRVVQIVRRESEEVGRQTINQSQGTPRERIETSRVVQIVRRESEEVGRQTINQSQGTPRDDDGDEIEYTCFIKEMTQRRVMHLMREIKFHKDQIDKKKNKLALELKYRRILRRRIDYLRK